MLNNMKPCSAPAVSGSKNMPSSTMNARPEDHRYTGPPEDATAATPHPLPGDCFVEAGDLDRFTVSALKRMIPVSAKVAGSCSTRSGVSSNMEDGVFAPTSSRANVSTSRVPTKKGDLVQFVASLRLYRRKDLPRLVQQYSTVALFHTSSSCAARGASTTISGGASSTRGGSSKRPRGGPQVEDQNSPLLDEDEVEEQEEESQKQNRVESNRVSAAPPARKSVLKRRKIIAAEDHDEKGDHKGRALGRSEEAHATLCRATATEQQGRASPTRREDISGEEGGTSPRRGTGGTGEGFFCTPNSGAFRKDTGGKKVVGKNCTAQQRSTPSAVKILQSSTAPSQISAVASSQNDNALAVNSEEVYSQSVQKLQRNQGGVGPPGNIKTKTTKKRAQMNKTPGSVAKKKKLTDWLFNSELKAPGDRPETSRLVVPINKAGMIQGGPRTVTPTAVGQAHLVSSSQSAHVLEDQVSFTGTSRATGSEDHAVRLQEPHQNIGPADNLLLLQTLHKCSYCGKQMKKYVSSRCYGNLVHRYACESKLVFPKMTTTVEESRPHDNHSAEDMLWFFEPLIRPVLRLEMWENDVFRVYLVVPPTCLSGKTARAAGTTTTTNDYAGSSADDVYDVDGGNEVEAQGQNSSSARNYTPDDGNIVQTYHRTMARNILSELLRCGIVQELVIYLQTAARSSSCDDAASAAGEAEDTGNTAVPTWSHEGSRIEGAAVEELYFPLADYERVLETIETELLDRAQIHLPDPTGQFSSLKIDKIPDQVLSYFRNQQKFLGHATSTSRAAGSSLAASAKSLPARAVDGQKWSHHTRRMEEIVDHCCLVPRLEKLKIWRHLRPYQKLGVEFGLQKMEMDEDRDFFASALEKKMGSSKIPSTPVPSSGKFMSSSRMKNKGILLADEMGLGKTRQALAIVFAKQLFPCLFIVKAVTRLAWKREIEMMYCDKAFKNACQQGGDDVTTTRTPTVGKDIHLIASADDALPNGKHAKLPKCVIISYHMAVNLLPQLLLFTRNFVCAGTKLRTERHDSFSAPTVVDSSYFCCVVVDEAHCLRRASGSSAAAAAGGVDLGGGGATSSFMTTQISRLLKKIPKLIFLTGTPCMHKIDDLRTQIALLTSSPEQEDAEQQQIRKQQLQDGQEQLAVRNIRKGCNKSSINKTTSKKASCTTSPLSFLSLYDLYHTDARNRSKVLRFHEFQLLLKSELMIRRLKKDVMADLPPVLDLPFFLQVTEHSYKFVSKKFSTTSKSQGKENNDDQRTAEVVLKQDSAATTLQETTMGPNGAPPENQLGTLQLAALAKVFDARFWLREKVVAACVEKRSKIVFFAHHKRVLDMLVEWVIKPITSGRGGLPGVVSKVAGGAGAATDRNDKASSSNKKSSSGEDKRKSKIDEGKDHRTSTSGLAGKKTYGAPTSDADDQSVLHSNSSSTIRYIRVDGDLDARQKQHQLDLFQGLSKGAPATEEQEGPPSSALLKQPQLPASPRYDIALVSMTAAGIGINGLEQASTAVFLELPDSCHWWQQCRARLDRFGQKNEIVELWYLIGSREREYRTASYDVEEAATDHDERGEQTTQKGRSGTRERQEGAEAKKDRNTSTAEAVHQGDDFPPRTSAQQLSEDLKIFETDSVQPAAAATAVWNKFSDSRRWAELNRAAGELRKLFDVGGSGGGASSTASDVLVPVAPQQRHNYAGKSTRVDAEGTAHEEMPQSSEALSTVANPPRQEPNSRSRQEPSCDLQHTTSFSPFFSERDLAFEVSRDTELVHVYYSLHFSPSARDNSNSNSTRRTRSVSVDAPVKVQQQNKKARTASIPTAIAAGEDEQADRSISLAGRHTGLDPFSISELQEEDRHRPDSRAAQGIDKAAADKAWSPRNSSLEVGHEDQHQHDVDLLFSVKEIATRFYRFYDQQPTWVKARLHGVPVCLPDFSDLVKALRQEHNAVADASEGGILGGIAGGGCGTGTLDVDVVEHRGSSCLDEAIHRTTTTSSSTTRRYAEVGKPSTVEKLMFEKLKAEFGRNKKNVAAISTTTTSETSSCRRSQKVATKCSSTSTRTTDLRWVIAEFPDPKFKTLTAYVAPFDFEQNVLHCANCIGERIENKVLDDGSAVRVGADKEERCGKAKAGLTGVPAGHQEGLSTIDEDEGDAEVELQREAESLSDAGHRPASTKDASLRYEVVLLEDEEDEPEIDIKSGAITRSTKIAKQKSSAAQPAASAQKKNSQKDMRSIARSSRTAAKRPLKSQLTQEEERENLEMFVERQYKSNARADVEEVEREGGKEHPEIKLHTETTRETARQNQKQVLPDQVVEPVVQDKFPDTAIDFSVRVKLACKNDLFCCGKCSREYKMKRSGSKLRQCLFQYEKGQCQQCAVDCDAVFLQLLQLEPDHFLEEDLPVLAGATTEDRDHVQLVDGSRSKKPAAAGVPSAAGKNSASSSNGNARELLLRKAFLLPEVTKTAAKGTPGSSSSSMRTKRKAADAEKEQKAHSTERDPSTNEYIVKSKYWENLLTKPCKDLKQGDLWHCDHVKEVQDGGGEAFQWHEIQTLCVFCHLRKTHGK
ncbi:unnamed protein product [Amoebophrya sp. A120]|nr:unnamed protein product [Amoebophrya sp. A120]|eukprot:GSA120T00004590001.1